MENKSYDFKSTDLLFKIYNYRKPLIIVGALAFVLSSIIAFVITPEYKATVVLFPAPSDALSKALISTRNASQNTGVFGEDPEVERILQTLNSDELKRQLVMKYGLFAHYEIDSTKSHSRSAMSKKMNSNFSFTRTPFMAIEVSVFDTDPVLAARMANDIPDLIDTVMNAMERKRSRAAYEIVKKEYDDKVAAIDQKGEELRQIMKKGIYDFESQSEMYNRAYAEAVAAGNQRGVKALEEKLAVLSEYGQKYINLRDFLLYESENLAQMSGRLKEAKVDAEQTLDHVFVLNKSEVPDKKARPRRVIIVLTSVISALIFCFVSLLLYEVFLTYRETEKSKEV